MLPQLLQICEISIEWPLYDVGERNISADFRCRTNRRIFKQGCIYGQLWCGKQDGEGAQMSAVALDVIFIYTLELTAIFRPSFVYLIPINTRKVALS